MGRKMYVLNGGKLGRPAGTNENVQTFLNKPKTQSIIKFLNMGKSVRDISSRLGVSTSTIYKVKQYWKPEMV
jgi:DNA-binding NarL/FixJ family response regulator